MADAKVSTEDLLAKAPSSIDVTLGLALGKTPEDVYRPEIQLIRNMILRSALSTTRVVSGHAAIADGTSGSTTALYRANVALGEALVDGVYDRNAALVDEVLIGAGQTITSYDTAGAAAVVISADNNDVKFALVAIEVAGAIEWRAVFGAEAATGTAVAPTEAQICAALKAAAITDHNDTVFLVLARGTYARGVGTVAMTGVDPSSDDGLRSEQVSGSLCL